MKVFDFLYYLNYRYKSDRSFGSTFVWLTFCVLSIGLLYLIQASGFDLVASLIDLYPFDISDSVRSKFNKKSGPAVLFCMPFAWLVIWYFYSKERTDKIIERYDAMNLVIPAFVTITYSVGLLVVLFLSLFIGSGDWLALGFLLQIFVTAIVHFFVVDAIIKKIRA